MAEDIDLIEDEISEQRKRWKLEEALREAKAEIKRANERADRAEARSKVVVAALAGGANPDHLTDVAGRIDRAGWTLKDGHPVMPKSDLEPEEWVKTLRGEAKHLFVQIGDAPAAPSVPNAPGSSGVASQSVPTDRSNPWTEAGWDDMAQNAVFRANSQRAEAMAKAAGSRIGALDPRLAPRKPAY